MVLVSGGTDYNGGSGLANGNSAGDVTMADGAVVQSADGSITLRAPGNVQVSVVNGDSDSGGGVGGVTITADYGGPVGGLSDNVGAVSEVLTAETVNVEGNVVTITAATGVGAGGDIETEVVQLSVVNSTSGDVVLYEVTAGGALEVTGATAVGANVDIQTQDGDLTVSGAISTNGAGTVTLEAGMRGRVTMMT